MTFLVPVSPERNRPHDKFERSPNRAAGCRVCLRKIMRDKLRVGVQVYDYVSPHRSARRIWFPHYYHAKCLSLDEISQLYLKPESSEEMKKLMEEFVNLESAHQAAIAEEEANDDSEAQDEIEAARRNLVVQRQELRERIKTHRDEIAASIDRPSHTIFSDATLDDIVVRLPSNSKGLLSCTGIGAYKKLKYGPWILQHVRDWKAANKGEPPVNQTLQGNSGNAANLRVGLFEKLLAKRNEIAQIYALGDIPEYLSNPSKILNKSILEDIVQKMPTSIADLSNCKGMSPKRVQEHGHWIIQCIQEYMTMGTSNRRSTRATVNNTESSRRLTRSATASAATTSTRTSTKSTRTERSRGPITRSTSRHGPALVTPEKKSTGDHENYSEDNDFVEVEKTLSLDEVLRQRYSEAEKKGEVVNL